ncbi:MAG: peptide-methionine (S)-S-oxide reductase MsrA [Blastocatellia bacterium]
MIEKIILGAGCFWGVEDLFRQVLGIVSTCVGYSGGFLENPSYEDVCNGRSGHTEVIEIKYDTTQISLQEILNLFWDNHNPTYKNKAQYKSVIFYFTPEQKNLAENLKEQLAKSQKYNNEIRTDILPAQTFYKAEEYHQKYYEKQKIKFEKYLSICKVDLTD